MGKDSPNLPPGPDIESLISQQAEQNRISQFTPFGDIRFGSVGEQGQFLPDLSGTATFVDLAPEQAEAVALQQQIASTLGGRALEQTGFLPTGPIDLSGLTQSPTSLDRSGLAPLPGAFDPSGFTRVPTSLSLRGLPQLHGVGPTAGFAPLQTRLRTGGLPQLQSIGTQGLAGLPTQLDTRGLANLPTGLRTGAFAELPTGVDFQGLTALPGVDDFSQDAARVEQATFERARGLLDPQFAQQEERLRQRLANQGIPVEAQAASGTGAGGAPLGELSRFEQNRSEAFNRAALDAVGAGRAEQSRLFGLASQARQQGLGEQIAGAGLAAQQRQLLGGEQLQSAGLAQAARGQGVQERLASAGLAQAQRGQLFGERQTRAQQIAANRGQFTQEQLASAGLAQAQRGQLLSEQQIRAQQSAANRGQLTQEQLASAGLAQAGRGFDFQSALAGTDIGFQRRGQGLAEALQDVDLARTGRQQELAEQFAVRSGLFNELASTLGLGQVQTPQFAPSSPIDVLGAAGLQQQGNLAQFGVQQQGQQNFLSGLFGLGSAGLLGLGGLF